MPLFAAFVLSAGTLVHGFAAEPQNCKLIRIDEWAVRPEISTPVLEGRINGKRVAVLIDTGATPREGALMHRSLARRLGVPLQALHPSARVGGIGGESQAEIGYINEIRLGKAVREGWRVLVAGEGNQDLFIIGNQYFQDHELEFDLSRHRVRLFKSEDCRGQSLAYWTRSPGVVPIWVDGWTYVDVQVNGKPVHAILDSGSTTTIMDTSVLARIGAEAQLRSAPPGWCIRGMGKQAVASRIGQFDTFAIGDELIRNPKIYFADLRKDLPRTNLLFFQIDRYETPEMILGADFLRAHRVLIARPQSKLFFTYEGGTVFPILPAAACSEQAVEPKQ